MRDKRVFQFFLSSVFKHNNENMKRDRDIRIGNVGVAAVYGQPLYNLPTKTLKVQMILNGHLMEHSNTHLLHWVLRHWANL